MTSARRQDPGRNGELATVGARGETGDAAEQAAEGSRVLVADMSGDLLHRLVGPLQTALGLFDAQALHVVEHGMTGRRAKAPGETAFRQAEAPRRLPHRTGNGRMGIQPFLRRRHQRVAMIAWRIEDDEGREAVGMTLQGEELRDRLGSSGPGLAADQVEKLETGARVADIGCGHGYSTIFMAEAFPRSRFIGFDTHAPSLEIARDLAREASVGDRVTFVHASARQPLEGPFDLACFFDCLHDLGHPVEAARRPREALAADGTLMLVEPYASDRVEENLNPIGRLYYAASTAICCAHAISENGTHVLGAQAGEARLTRICHEAGFTRVRRATQTPFNLIIEARP